MESFPGLLPLHAAVSAVRQAHGDLPLLTVLYPGESAQALWENSGLESPDLLFETSFAALQRESLVCETTTPSKYLKTIRRSSRAYFASGASTPLMRASASPTTNAEAACGLLSDSLGSPRRMLLRHEESNALYAKMQYVRILVSQLRGDKSRKKSAQEELWKGQCGDAYWPSGNGGILRLPVRAAAYAALIEAEKTTRQRGGFAPGVIMADMDFDGEKEILYQGSDFNAYVHPRGATLFELDSLKSLTNYVNVLSDFENIDELHGPRHCFQDGFSPMGCFEPEIGNYRDGIYSLEESDRPAHLAVLTREGVVDMGGKKRAVFIRKKYAFRKVALSVIYELANRESEELSLRFHTELNLAVGASPDAVYIEGHRDGTEKVVIPSDAAVATKALAFVRITNLKAEEHLELRSDKTFELLSRPLFLSAHGGLKELYEGASFVLGWDVTLPPESSIKIAVALEIRG
jgi:alpha-amylase